MPAKTALPDEFQERLRQLAASYHAADDPHLQSGFGGGAERWRAEREPILAAVAALLERFGYRVAGSSSGGAGPVTRFAWLRKPAARHGSAAARGPQR